LFGRRPAKRLRLMRDKMAEQKQSSRCAGSKNQNHRI
jgi:hypothetical protein